MAVQNKQGVDINRSTGHTKRYFKLVPEHTDYPTSNITDNANLEPNNNASILPAVEPQSASLELQNHQGIFWG